MICLVLIASPSSDSSMLRMIGRMQQAIIPNKPLGGFRQDGGLHEALPRRKARCPELRTAQPERNSLGALDSATIRAKGCMELAIAKLQLEWQLAEVAQHAISCQWLSVASMPQEVRLQESLGGLVGEGKELLRSSDEGSETCSMG